MAPFRFSTVVVGVGNTVLSGDGVGVHAVRALMRDPRLMPGIAILDGGKLGLELLGRIANARRILFLDAVHSSVAPGTVIRVEGDELLGTKIEWSVHQAGIADLMVALTLVSSKNAEVVVLGLRPVKVAWGRSLSPAVRTAVAPLVDAALDQLRVWHSSTSNLVGSSYRVSQEQYDN